MKHHSFRGNESWKDQACQRVKVEETADSKSAAARRASSSLAAGTTGKTDVSGHSRPQNFRTVSALSAADQVGRPADLFGDIEGEKARRAGLADANSAPTEAQIVAAARVLNKRHAGLCGVNEQDSWDLQAEDFKVDAKAALEAALAQPAA